MQARFMCGRCGNKEEHRYDGKLRVRRCRECCGLLYRISEPAE